MADRILPESGGLPLEVHELGDQPLIVEKFTTLAVD
jgi:hypothetical protein